MFRRPALPPDIKEFRSLIKTGKLFAVQNWIAEGKRISAPEIYWETPLQLAVETGFHSMIELFLKLNPDKDALDRAINYATGVGNFEVIKLLVEYGADIHSVDFLVVCQTGHPLIIRYFIERGIDTETGFPFAHALCHPKNRYIGVYMRYRDQFPSFPYQLNLALRFHAQRGNLKWVSLLMWAGGDPHLCLPDIDEKSDPDEDTSALEEAIYKNRMEILDHIGIDPKRDNLKRIFYYIALLGRSEMLEKLLTLAPDMKGKAGEELMNTAFFFLRSNMESFYGNYYESRARETIAFITRFAQFGARWNPDPGDMRRLRRLLYQYERGFIQHLIQQFLEHQVCSRPVLYKLLKNDKVKERFGFAYDTMMAELKSGKPVRTI